MKNKSLILATLALATLATGCNRSNPAGPDPATSNTNSMPLADAWQKTRATTADFWVNAKAGATNAWAGTKATATQVWVDIKETLGPATDYTYDKKDEFVAKALVDLDALDQKMAELSDRAAKVSESAREDAQVKLQDLRIKRAALNARLENVKNATATDWDNAKTAFQNSYDEVANSLAQTWQWLSDKLGP